MEKLKLPVLALIVLFLHGCASGAKFENMAYTEASDLQYDKALHNNMGVSDVRGGQETNPLWTSEISNDAFREALKRSLASQGLMSEKGRYQLKVKLIEVKQPMIGLDLKVTTRVKYTLEDTRTDRTVMDEVIVASYTASFGDAVVAVKRLRLANEGSGKSNIESFLRKLSSLKISEGGVSVAD